MTSDYTPTTDEVREAWLTAEYEERDWSTSDDDLRAEFDRWLAEHDRKVAERAWYEGWDASERFGYPIDGVDSETYKNPYTKENNK